MVKISGLSSLLSGKRDEAQANSPRQFGDTTPATVQPEGGLKAAENTDPLMDKRAVLKHLQEARAGLMANYNAKKKLADKAESIAAGIKDRLAEFSDLNDQIDRFYQQQIEDSISTDGDAVLAELPEHLAARKRELDGLERQIVVAENCAERRREEASEVWREVDQLVQNRENALHDIMVYISGIRAANIDQLWGRYVKEVVSLWGLTRQQFAQYDIYNTPPSGKLVYTRKDLAVPNHVLGASMGYALDRQKMAAQYIGNVCADEREWRNVIKRLEEDAFADCSDLCPELPGIPEAG